VVVGIAVVGTAVVGIAAVGTAVVGTAAAPHIHTSTLTFIATIMLDWQDRNKPSKVYGG